MGIGIGAQGARGARTPSHTATARLCHWELNGPSSLQNLKHSAAEPWVHQQHPTFQAHTGVLCGDLKNAVLFIFRASCGSCCHPRADWAEDTGLRLWGRMAAAP